MLNLPAQALPISAAAKTLNSGLGRVVGGHVVPVAIDKRLPDGVGTSMLAHCAEEMNHLAGFLPQLHREFSGSI